MAERSVNVLHIVGRVGKEPEVKESASGQPYAKFSVATTRPTKEPKTDWHRVTVFGKTAEFVRDWVHKGDRIYVEGRVEYSESNGKYYTDVIASEVVALGSAGERTAAAPAPTAPFADDDELPFK